MVVAPFSVNCRRGKLGVWAGRWAHPQMTQIYADEKRMVGLAGETAFRTFGGQILQPGEPVVREGR
ncbi:hypothetical protein CVU37_09155 [candidate division BRC1 bacterium HGW-BRC1-1]|nr:MAG: hypothetical protein CVU37_09155 [candidate division BRC1 bacterium HGW-BRC1-1]